MRPSPSARPRLPLPLLALLVFVLSQALWGCRPQPSAALELGHADGADRAEAEPVARDTVVVEAPSLSPTQDVELDWQAANPELARLVDAGEARYRTDYDSQHPFVGAAEPLVTIVVFTDYQCPYCGRLEQTLNDLLARYPDSLRVVYRQFPLAFHKHAEPAARAALAAGNQGAFVPLHRWLFANQKQLDRPSIEAVAAQLGLDSARFAADIDSQWVGDRVHADMDFGSRRGVRGTPMSFVNGRPLSGAVPFEQFETLLLEEVELAERLLSVGVPRHAIWAHFMAAALDEAWSRTKTPPQAAPPAKKALQADVRVDTKLAGLPRRGAKKAKVELLMCGDFDCPYCARSVTTLAALEKRYSGDLAVLFRHLPLPMHKNARAAHRAAVAADNQGQFWAMFEALYAAPKERSDAELLAMAKAIQLDLKRFRKDIAAPATDALIDAQRDFCQKQLGVSGTPTFFINGRALSGAQPEASFAAIIDEELAGKGPPPLRP